MNLIQKKIILLAVCVVMVILIFVSLQWWLNPTRSEAEYREVAQISGNSKDWSRLVSVGTEWAINYPASSLAYAALGDGYRGQERHIEAVAAYEKSLGFDAKNPAVWKYYGVELINVGRPAEAATACANSINLSSEVAEAWYCEAVALAIQGDNQNLDKVAVELERRSPTLYKNFKSVVTEQACITQKDKLSKAWCSRK